MTHYNFLIGGGAFRRQPETELQSLRTIPAAEVISVRVAEGSDDVANSGAAAAAAQEEESTDGCTDASNGKRGRSVFILAEGNG